MAFDVTFAALSHPLFITPFGSPLRAPDVVEFFSNRSLVQQMLGRSKILVEKIGKKGGRIMKKAFSLSRMFFVSYSWGSFWPEWEWIS